MSYSKRNTYPSIKTPGVYPDDYDDKQINLIEKHAQKIFKQTIAPKQGLVIYL